MGSRVKNFNITGVHGKMRVLKPIYTGNCPERGAWTVFRFKGGVFDKKKGSGVFEVGLIPQCTLWV